ncbi:MAG: hypothetical protein WC714_06175 [Candidatus Obscuribacterales bacterium]
MPGTKSGLNSPPEIFTPIKFMPELSACAAPVQGTNVMYIAKKDRKIERYRRTKE